MAVGRLVEKKGFADLIEANAEELSVVEAIDAGKPVTDCRTIDVPDAINTLRWYAEAADKVFGKTSPTGADALGLIVREPVGVVGGVLPWNFPLMTLAWKIGPALATGNSLVIKPAELASLTTIRLAELGYDVVGVDLADPGFWDAGLDLVERQLRAAEDALALESAEGNPNANLLVVRTGDEDDERVQQLEELLHSDEVRQFIEDTYEGAVIPAF